MSSKHVISDPVFDGEMWRVEITTTSVHTTRLGCKTKEAAVRAANAWAGIENGNTPGNELIEALKNDL